MNSTKLFHPPDGESDETPYHTPLEKKLDQALSPFDDFAQSQVIASFFLILSTIAALLLATLPQTQTFYDNFVTTPFGFHLGNNIISGHLKFWVNDFLITIFFFFVGLEIKRELLIGELVEFRKTFLIIMAALGGMLFPACIYFAFNAHTPAVEGWGIPMATDTAFALGILVLFKNKLPRGIFTFLAALAVLDDIGAVIVVALFYTEAVVMPKLIMAFGCYLFLVLLNYAGFRHALLYLIIGLVIWFLTEEAGIHGTIAGILVALVIPARPRRGPRHFIRRVRQLVLDFEVRRMKEPMVLGDHKQHKLIESVEELAQQATTPLQRWETRLDLPVSLLILPLFAFVNAGISMDLHSLKTALSSPITQSIMVALLVGKPLGIFSFSYLVHKLKLGRLPQGVTFKHVMIVSILGGIGFTMSLFISNIAFFDDDLLLEYAKMGILLGSTFAAIIAVVWLLQLSRSRTGEQKASYESLPDVA